MSTPDNSIILYQTLDGTASLEVRLDHETVWLTQKQMAELFLHERSVITKHLRNVFAEGELDKDSSVKKFGISEFQQKAPNPYNLDVIISVGSA